MRFSGLWLFLMVLKIVHDEPACIGCGSCAAIEPSHWFMDGDKAHVRDSKKIGEEEHKELKQLGNNKEAAESCPVNCIHLFENGKKLV